MATRGRALRYEAEPEEAGRHLRDVMRLGDQTIDQLIAAQKAALEALEPMVHKEVWKHALKLAGGDRSRIMIFSPEEVHVVNHPGEKPPWLV